LLAASIFVLVVSFSPGLRRDRASDDHRAGRRVAGREYVLESSEGFVAQPDAPIHLDFLSNDLLSLNAGCSKALRFYKIADGELTLPYHWMGALAHCKKELVQQDRVLTLFFSYPPRVEVYGDRLTLIQGSMRLNFLDRQVMDGVPLDNDPWHLTSIQTEPWGAWKIGEPKPTLTFSDRDRMEIFNGCGKGKGNYKVTGDQVTFSNVPTRGRFWAHLDSCVWTCGKSFATAPSPTEWTTGRSP
jgi:heat shock protein HslJ